jgi:hypothetical protein
MAWVLSHRNNLGLNKTVSPELVLTNNSTFTKASGLAEVLAQEVLGNGYGRIPLTIKSNKIDAQDYGRLVYNTVTHTASGGDIVYDRLVLLADGDWAAYDPDFAGTIADGETASFNIQFGIGESGVPPNGEDGQDAYTVTTTSFAQPDVGATVNVEVGNGEWTAVGAIVYYSDGANASHYEVVAIGATSLTLKNLGYPGAASPSTTMLSGGQIVPSGIKGAGGSGIGGGFSLLHDLVLGSSATPGIGALSLNNAAAPSVTLLTYSEIAYHNADVGTPVKPVALALAKLRVNSLIQVQEVSSGVEAWYEVVGAAQTSGYYQFTVSHVYSSGNFTDSERLSTSLLI